MDLGVYDKMLDILFFIEHFKAFKRVVKNYRGELKNSELMQIANYLQTDKGIPGHGYTRVYEHFLYNRRNSIQSMCEIGLLQHRLQDKEMKVYNCAPSLEMWRKYLPNTHIIGFDIQSFELPKDNLTTIVQGDQSKRQDLQKIVDYVPEIDFIIDDGLHASEHQQVTISFLFKHIKPGGYFFIEDLNYQPEAYERDHIPKTKMVLNELISTGVWNSPVAFDEEKKAIEASIDSVLFFDSMKPLRKNKSVCKKCDAFAVLIKKE